MSVTLRLARSAAWPRRAAITAVFFSNGLGIGAWAAAIPLLKLRLALSDGELGFVLFAFMAGAALAMVGAVHMSGRMGLAGATRVAALGFAAALALPAFAGGLSWLAAAAFVVGFANGLLDVTMNAFASHVEARWGAAIMSSFHAGFSAGGLAGAALGGLLAAFGAGWTLGAAEVFGLATVAVSWRWLRDGEAAPETAEPGLSLPILAALPLCTVGLLCAICEGAMADWTGVYLADVVRVSPVTAASGYAAFSAAMVLGRLFGDGVVRRWGRVQVMRRGSALAAFGLALAVFAPALGTSIVGFALVGIGLSNVVPAVFSLAAGLTTAPAVGVAMAATAGYTGMLGGPAVIGAIAQSAGLRAGMGFLILCALAAVAASRRLRD